MFAMNKRLGFAIVYSVEHCIDSNPEITWHRDIIGTNHVVLSKGKKKREGPLRQFPSKGTSLALRCQPQQPSDQQSIVITLTKRMVN